MSNNFIFISGMLFVLCTSLILFEGYMLQDVSGTIARSLWPWPQLSRSNFSVLCTSLLMCKGYILQDMTESYVLKWSHWPSPQFQIIYFFIRDRISQEQLTFFCVCTSLVVCDRCMDLTCQVQIWYFCQWQNPGVKWRGDICFSSLKQYL
jgi:hypothetical protein